MKIHQKMVKYLDAKNWAKLQFCLLYDGIEPNRGNGKGFDENRGQIGERGKIAFLPHFHHGCNLGLCRQFSKERRGFLLP